MRELEGYLEKLGEKGLGRNRYKRRWFSLKDGVHLNYYEKHDLKKLCGSIVVADILDAAIVEEANVKKRTSRIIRKAKEEPMYLTIVTEKRTYNLSADDLESAMYWVGNLKQILHERETGEEKDEADFVSSSVAATKPVQSSVGVDQVDDVSDVSGTSPGGPATMANTLPIAEEDSAIDGLVEVENVQSPPMECIIVGDPALDIRNVVSPAAEESRDEATTGAACSAGESAPQQPASPVSDDAEVSASPANSTDREEDTAEDLAGSPVDAGLVAEEAPSDIAAPADTVAHETATIPTDSEASVPDGSEAEAVDSCGESDPSNEADETMADDVLDAVSDAVMAPAETKVEEGSQRAEMELAPAKSPSRKSLQLSPRSQQWQRSAASSNLTPEVQNLQAIKEIAKDMTGETLQGEEAAQFAELRVAERELRHHNADLKHSLATAEKELKELREDQVAAKLELDRVRAEHLMQVSKQRETSAAEVAALKAELHSARASAVEEKHRADAADEARQRAEERASEVLAGQQRIYEELRAATAEEGGAAVASLGLLKQEKLELEHRLERVEAEAEAACVTVTTEFKEQLADLSSERDQASMQVAELSEQLTSVKAELAAAVAEHAALSQASAEELSLVRADLESKNVELASAVEQIGGLKAQEEARSFDVVEGADGRVQQLTNDLQEAKSALVQSKKSSAALERRVAEAEHRAQGLKVRLAKAEEDLDASGHAKEHLMEELDAASAAARKAEEEAESARAAVSSVSSPEPEVKQGEADHATAEENKQKIQQLGGQVKKLKFELASKAKQIAKLQKANEELASKAEEGAVAKGEEDEGHGDGRLEEVLEQVEEQDAQVANTMATLHLLNQQMQQTKVELEATKAKLTTTEAELTARDEAINGLNADLKKARLASMDGSRAVRGDPQTSTLVTDLRNDLEKTRMSNQQLAKAVSRHQHEIGILNDKNDQLSKDSKMAVEDLTGMLHKAQESYNDMRRRYFLQVEYDPSEQEEQLRVLKQDYFFSLAVGLKLNLAQEGFICNVDIQELFEECSDVPVTQWRAWLMKRLQSASTSAQPGGDVAPEAGAEGHAEHAQAATEEAEPAQIEPEGS